MITSSWYSVMVDFDSVMVNFDSDKCWYQQLKNTANVYHMKEIYTLEMWLNSQPTIIDSERDMCELYSSLHRLWLTSHAKNLSVYTSLYHAGNMS